jgi:ribosome-binding protein aMBF1 (putative translation factor)
MEHKPLTRACWLCGKAVKLEDCKIDEHGLAVHEDCYVVRVALSATRTIPSSRAL